MRLLFLTISFLLSSVALSQTVITHEDGFVKAFINPHNQQQAVILDWQKSSNGYGRDVIATLVQIDKNSVGTVESWKMAIKRKTYSSISEAKPIKPQEGDFEKLGIVNPEIQETIRQVQQGANRHHEFHSVDQYIKETGLTLQSYNRAKNIEITKKYGAEFSAQVYRALLLAQEDTKKGMAEFIPLLKEALKQEEIRFDGSYELYVAKGLLQNTEDVKKVKGMFENVLAAMVDLGLPVHTFPLRTADAVQVNAEIMANEIMNRKSTKPFYILAVSKAVPETLGALALLNERGYFSKPENKNMVAGVIYTAGPQEGMHFADFAAMPLISKIIKSKSMDIGKANKADMTTFTDAMKSLSHKNLGPYMEKVAAHLPAVPSVNLIGISNAGNGYAEYKPLRSMQQNLFNRWFFPSHGANDGIVEYSSLLRTRILGEQAFTLVADGDHCIFPCKLEGQTINSDKEQVRSFKALFEFLRGVSLGGQGSCRAGVGR